MKTLWRSLAHWLRPPETFTSDGKVYTKGKDYHTEHDKELIQRWGESGLNFVPSTPPDYR